MENLLLSSLDAVESALDALTGSIQAYNPSVAAAEALLAADGDLKSALDELCTHQTNARRLAQLRAEVDAADAVNRRRLQALADLHQGLTDAPLSSLTAGARPVDVRELLDVAAATARYAAPVGYVPPVLGVQAQTQAQAQQVQEQGQTQEQTQIQGGVRSPVVMSPGPIGPNTAVGSPEAMETDTQQQQSQTPGGTQPMTQPFTQPDSSFAATVPFTSTQDSVGAGGGVDTNATTAATTDTATGPATQQPAANPGLSILSALDLNRLDPAGAAPYLPWISEEMIAKSHLARTQGVSGAILERVEAEKEELQQQQQQQRRQSEEGMQQQQQQPQTEDQGAQQQTQQAPERKQSSAAAVFKWDDDD